MLIESLVSYLIQLNFVSQTPGSPRVGKNTRGSIDENQRSERAAEKGGVLAKNQRRRDTLFGAPFDSINRISSDELLRHHRGVVPAEAERVVQHRADGHLPR